MAGNFDKLHEEELIMILKHVQCKYALYFTCKKLSELSLQIDIKDKNYELLVWSNISKDYAESIINSKRIITSLIIKQAIENELLNSVLENIGSNIKKLTVIECNFSELGKCLNLLPNIEKLVLTNVTFESEPQSFPLEKLTELMVELSYPYKMDMVSRAFPRFSWVTVELRRDISLMEEFITKQKNLKVLKIIITCGDFELINFKDSKLEIFDYNTSKDLIPYLKSQPQLKQLHLSGEKINDDTFRFVTQFKLLTNLTINVHGVTRFAISDLRHLTKLKSLEIMNTNYGNYRGEITDLSRLQFDELTVLTITFPGLRVLSSDLIEIAANFKNLSTINMTIKDVTQQHIRPFMTTVKSLSVQVRIYYGDDERYETLLNDIGIFDINLQNLELEDLNITGLKLTVENLPLIINNYPNLKSIALRFDGSMHDEHVEQLLIGMPKLQTFEVCGGSTFTSEVFDIFKKHGKNLKEILMMRNFAVLYKFEQAFRNHPQNIVLKSASS